MRMVARIVGACAVALAVTCPPALAQQQAPPTGGAVPPAPAPPAAAPGVFTGPTVPGAQAKIVAPGVAAAPQAAPPQVQQAIWAGNALQGMPYRYGGGHQNFQDSGYDCSGTVSFALHGGGLLDAPLDSSGFMGWGLAGPGAWITVYTNPGHGYVVIAGLRLDTSAANDPGGQKGPRWRKRPRGGTGYTVRHPAGF